MVSVIWGDLLRTDRYTKDLTLRRFINTLMLYSLIFLVGMANILVLYFKIFVR